MKVSEVIADESITPQDAEAAAIKYAADALKQRKAALKVAKAQKSLQKAQRAKLQAAQPTS
jgi:hypothetical protein